MRTIVQRTICRNGRGPKRRTPVHPATRRLNTGVRNAQQGGYPARPARLFEAIVMLTILAVLAALVLPAGPAVAGTDYGHATVRHSCSRLLSQQRSELSASADRDIPENRRKDSIRIRSAAPSDHASRGTRDSIHLQIELFRIA